MELSILGLAIVVVACTLYIEKETKFGSAVLLVTGFLILASQALK
jgi:hypothetical protein